MTVAEIGGTLAGIHQTASMDCGLHVTHSHSRPPSFELSQLIALFNSARYAELEDRALLLTARYPDSGLLWKLLAASLQMQGKDALKAFKKAAERLPNDPEPYNHLGIIFESRGQLDEAMACYAHAIRIEPGFVEARCNLGNVQCEQGRLEDGAATFREALTIRPDSVEAHYNLADALLAMGHYEEGWREYEYRLNRRPLGLAHPASRLPQWRGEEPSKGETLLVLEEQGFGDKIQFVRYLEPAVKCFPAGVGIIVGDPLRNLFRRSFPNVEVLDSIPSDRHAWQWQCPLLSLPLAFGTTLQSIPGTVPYLTPNPVRVTYWQARIASLRLPASMLKVGIVWKPGTTMKNAAQRTIKLEQLMPLLNISGCAWFSLQKEPDPDKSKWVESGKLVDWTSELDDFDETAALAANLDLIISADTSVVHLAGALGLPTWLANRRASEWRWMRDREDSPWYPTMRIFTQRNPGDWDDVAKRMSDALREWRTAPSA